jgi:RNA polymerase sigma-70 factor (ECF subfamily)
MLRARGRLALWDDEDIARELDRAESEPTIDEKLAVLHDERAARAKVLEALSSIHPRYARAIRVRLLEEQSREDAASLFEVSPATFDVLFHRAMGALKKHLEARSAKEAPAERERP